MTKEQRMSMMKDDFGYPGAVFGKGSLDAKILLVGQQPSRDEDLIYPQKAVDLLDGIFRGTGLSFDEVYYTNLVLSPPAGNKPTRKEIREGMVRLSKEIEIVDPYVIVTLGPEVAKAMTSVKTRFASFARHPDFPFTTASTEGKAVSVERPAVVTFSPKEIVEKGKVELKKGSDVHWLFLAIQRAKNIRDMHIELLGE